MAGWDDDEDDDDGGWDDETDPEFALTPDDGEGMEWEIPQSWDEWWDFDWESYDGDYEEYALSADY